MNRLIILSILTLLTACSSDSGGDAAATSLACTPTEINVGAAKNVVALFVTAEKEWTVYSEDSWITTEIPEPDPLDNRIPGDAFVEIAANTTTAVRSGTVHVKSGMDDITIPVTQAAPMVVSTTDIYSIAKGETFTLNVLNADGWTATANGTWVKAVKTDGSTLMLTTEANTLTTSRTATVDVKSGTETVTVTVKQESAEMTDITVPDGYTLVWHDEFNEGTTLNTADWTHEVQSAGWVNNELQTYVNGSVGGKRVTELADGKLNINCFKGSDGKVYSGRVYARVGEGWLHGYFEARILLPSGKGTWPAFWMMPVNNNYTSNPWPGCGEIDIMEEVGCVPDEVSSSIHCNAYNHTIGTQKTQKRNIGTAETEYHIYACEWTTDMLRFYVDGEELMTFRNEGSGKDTWPFTYAFYPILNLAWGGSWGGMYGVDESVLPVTMKVDYIRVFQKK